MTVDPVPPAATRIAAVVCDVDGTLLTSGHVLTDAVRGAVRDTVAAGTRFLLASARPPAGIAYLYRRLSVPDEPYVALNGALVMAPSGEPLLRTMMAGRAALEILAAAEECDLTPNVFVGGRWLVTRRDRWVAEEERATECPAEVVGDLSACAQDGVEKISLMGPRARIRRGEVTLQRRDGLLRWTRVVRSNPGCLELTSRSVSKQVGVLWLLGRLDIPPSAVMAIGDGMNDVDVLQSSGLAVAMGHAALEVRASAGVVTTSNDEDGVARALRMWLLGEADELRTGEVQQ